MSSHPCTEFSATRRETSTKVIPANVSPAWAGEPYQYTREIQATSPSLFGKKSASGFTLIEVLMATAILAIGLMGVASVITWACVQDVRASHVSRGSFMVEEFLETATRAQHSAQAFNALTGTSAGRVVDGVRYTMNCTLAENTPVERCREMTCILSWNNQGSSASARYVYVLSPKF